MKLIIFNSHFILLLYFDDFRWRLDFSFTIQVFDCYFVIQVLLNITSEQKFFNPVRGRFRKYVDQFTEVDERTLSMAWFEKKIKLVQNFLLLVAKLVPEKRAAIMAFIKPMMTKPSGDTAMFLYEILKLVARGDCNSVEDLDWKDMPLILKREEIFSSDLTNAINLKPVKKEGTYNSTEDYVDVYFRLLREDCFYKLKKSIHELLSGKLGKAIIQIQIYKVYV